MILTSSDYIQVGVTNKNCLKILPSTDQSSFQKFVVGDETGIINALEFTKNDLSIKFKTSAFDKEISRIELTGKDLSNRDRICAAGGSIIRCFTNKGKEYFKFDTNSTEIIRGLDIQSNIIWTSGEFLLNEYESQKDSISDNYYFLSNDKINDLFIHSIFSQGFNPILACQDNTVKVLESGKEKYRYITNSSANCLAYYTQESKIYQSKQALEKTMLVGLSDGSLLNLCFNKEGPVQIWNLKASNKSKAGIILAHVFDFTKNGINDVMIARDDASLELYCLNVNGELELNNRQILNEAITGIDCGVLSRLNVNEYLVSTYSGKIFGISENDNEEKKNELRKKKTSSKDLENKIKLLREEIDKIKKNIDETSNIENPDYNMSTLPNPFKSNYKLVKNSEEASYSIHIDSQIPLNFVLVQSNLNIELIENINNPAILSISEPTENEKSNSLLQATYRFNDNNICKFEIRFRTLEGKMGAINVFLVPNITPKTAQMFSINVKGLSLHEKSLDEIDENSLPLNVVTFEGDFTKSDIQMWVSYLLNDPPKSEDEEVYFTYKSCFVGTYLFGKYNSKKAVFKSESISTIMIIKEFISHEASSRGIKISINWEINDKSVERILNLLNDKFEFHNKIIQQYQLLPAIKELQIQEGNIDFLGKEFQEIFLKEEEITNAFKEQPKRLQYLKGIITDLYYDRAMFKGISNVNQKIKTLIQSLNNFNIENVLNIIVKEK